MKLSFAPLLRISLLAACVTGGAWLGLHAYPHVHSWLNPALPETADNSRYFHGETAPVVMFGTATCPWCVKTRELLDMLGVAYREHRIDASPEAMSLFRSLDADGVPVLLIGSRRIYGFDETRIRAALREIAAPPREPTLGVDP